MPCLLIERLRDGRKPEIQNAPSDRSGCDRLVLVLVLDPVVFLHSLSQSFHPPSAKSFSYFCFSRTRTRTKDEDDFELRSKTALLHRVDPDRIPCVVLNSVSTRGWAGSVLGLAVLALAV